MLLCTCVHEGICTCVCGGQKSMLSVFLNYSTSHFLRQDLSTQSGAQRFRSAAGQTSIRVPPVSFLPHSWVYKHVPQYLVFHASPGHLTEDLMLVRKTLHRLKHFPNTRE